MNPLPGLDRHAQARLLGDRGPQLRSGFLRHARSHVIAHHGDELERGLLLLRHSARVIDLAQEGAAHLRDPGDCACALAFNACTGRCEVFDNLDSQLTAATILRGPCEHRRSIITLRHELRTEALDLFDALAGLPARLDVSATARTHDGRWIQGIVRPCVPGGCHVCSA